MQTQFKTFTVMISNINRNIRRLKTDIMAKFDLKCPHLSSLYYLYTDGPLTAKELGALCQEDKGALSRSIDYLEKEGFINNLDKKKKYKNPMALTDKGKVVGEYIVKKIDEIFYSASSTFDSEQIKNFFETLKSVDKKLEAFIVSSER